MSQQQHKARLASIDPLWERVQTEAEDAIARDASLSGLILSTILNQPGFERALAHRLASRLHHPDMAFGLLEQAFIEAVESDAAIADAFRTDLLATYDRDPACDRYIEPLLYFKGYHAVQTHRLAHWLWRNGRRDFALYLQSRASEVFQVDIHPAVPFGKGIFLDHATGVVVGETAVVEDDVSLLQGVTLGGTGKEDEDRHPKIRRGVLIGAGAKVLGNIEVGHCARIAAGSVVLKPVPALKTVAGVPARVVGDAPCKEPSRTMDHLLANGEKDAKT